MKITRLIEGIKKEGNCKVILQNSEAEIFAFHSVVECEYCEEDVLYLCNKGNMPDEGSLKQFNLLCFFSPDEEPFYEKYQELYPNSNLIFIKFTKKEKELFDFIGTMFLSELRYSQMITRLLDTFNKNSGLQGLVDEAYQILNYPIIILDTSYRIIAMFRPNPGDEIFELGQQRDLGYLSENNFFRLKRDKVYDQLREANSNYMVSKAIDSDYQWYNALIYIHGIEVAEIGILEYGRKFTDFDLRIFDFFRQLVKWEMEKSNFLTPNKNVMHSIFLSELLDQKFANSKLIEKRMKMLGWNKSPGYFVLTVFNDDMTNFHKKAEYFAFQVQKILYNLRWVVDKSHMILLISSCDTDFSTFSKDSTLSQLFSVNNMYGIVSNYFTDLLDMKKYYNQTMAIREFAHMRESSNPVIMYADYSFFHMARILSDSSYELEDFLHPAITLLLDYDTQHKTSYMSTLKEYLLTPENPALCAKNLCVHKNTYFYRLNKIRELLPLDLNDGLTRMRLLMSLELLTLRT